jgi:hypothetical protein
MAKLDTIALQACLRCGKDASFLRRIETVFVLNDKPSHNPVVICADCGSIMVRVGGMVGAFMWALHIPPGQLVPE